LQKEKKYVKLTNVIEWQQIMWIDANSVNSIRTDKAAEADFGRRTEPSIFRRKNQ